MSVPADDLDLWLEDVQGEAALAWVRERNARTEAELCARADFLDLKPRLKALLDDQARIPYVSRVGDRFYNFWQDAAHPRGLWRRTTLAGYRQPEPDWETVLDLDALAAAEGENWVWHGADVATPVRGADGQPVWRRCLIDLSRGGADATVVREFDLVERRFIPAEEGGFALPEAKSSAGWIDADTLAVGTDFGPGSMTDSGYPRVIRAWRRGTPLADAVTIHEGEPGDVSAWVSVDDTPGFERVVHGRSIDFYTTAMWLAAPDGTRRAIPKPADASLGFHERWAVMELRSDLALQDGARHPAGSLLVAEADELMALGCEAARWTALFTPTPTCSLGGSAWTRGHVLLNLLDSVANRVEALRFDAADGAWHRRRLDLPGPGTLGVSALHDPHVADDPLAEQCWLTYTDFLTPDSLMLLDARDGTTALLRQRPAYFDACDLVAEQHHATSADGTRVPYFLVRRRDAAMAGDTPTLLYGYGGFEVSMQPWYSGGFGLAWFARGGALAVANIRGGGEFGPAWHQAAVGERKPRSHDDFIAVAEDLVRTGLTRPARLGIMGGSNGGLLVGAAMVRRPDLFGAVVCQVPLLDMLRYHRLLAGASWMAEYGDPDQPDPRAWLARYSPYQNLREGTAYPRALFTTSTRDDRVHPGHARRMVARLEALGQPVLYHENIEGGHGGAADNAQRAHLQALEFAYLGSQLGV